MSHELRAMLTAQSQKKRYEKKRNHKERIFKAYQGRQIESCC
jgi:hypothetical protein